jgi:hypothetical protein
MNPQPAWARDAVLLWLWSSASAGIGRPSMYTYGGRLEILTHNHMQWLYLHEVSS